MGNRALSDDCKETARAMDELKVKFEELRKNRKLDLSEFEQWSQDDLLCWILSLENGRFEKYEAALKQAFAEREIDGECLRDIGKQDLFDCGVKSFKDQSALFKHIQKLTSTVNEGSADVNVTAYI